jgi:hypothetical protein
MDGYRAQDSDEQRLAGAFRNGDEDRIRVILHAEGYEWADPARDEQLRGAVEAERERIYALILGLAEQQDYATSMSWKALRRMLILSDDERGR